MTNGTVLVVDDEQSIRRICTLYLQAKGLRVMAIEDAEGILETARNESPDVIVLDLNMPGTDGFAATRMLKNVSETAGIPVLILSGRHDLDDKRNAMLECGADDYLTKPFDPEELAMRISVLQRRKFESERQAAMLHSMESQTEELRNNLGTTLAQQSRYADVIFDLLEDDFTGPLQMLNQMLHDIRPQEGDDARIERIRSGVRQLEGLLEKLAELRKYRFHEVKPELASISLGKLINPVLGVFARKAERTGFTFNRFCANTDYMIHTDAERVRRIISLLLDRTTESGNPGLVEFEASITADSLHLTIREESAGEDDRQTQVVDEPVSVKLMLARSIIDLFGGTITVQSAGSQNTTVSVLLPLSLF